MRSTLRVLAQTAGGVVGMLSGGFLLYLWGREVVAGITDWNNEDYLPAIVLTFGGPVFGAIIGAVAGALVGARIVPGTAGQEEQSSSPDSPERRSPRENLCPNCGRQVVEGYKTCKCCGADLKYAERRCRCNRTIDDCHYRRVGSAFHPSSVSRLVLGLVQCLIRYGGEDELHSVWEADP
jgi:hypothetical protein